MAQSIIEQIKVLYVKNVNGEETRVVSSLKDIAESDKQCITSLSILPCAVLGRDGSAKTDVSSFIKDFPLLSKLGYASEFSQLNVDQIQRNGCPNLRTIIRTKGDSSIVNPFTIKAQKGITASLDGSEEQLQAYANMIASGSGIESIYEVSPRTTVKTRKEPENSFATYQEIDEKLDTVAKKLDSIRNSANKADKVPSIESLKTLLGNFAGVITSSELSSVVNSIKNINVNVESSQLDNAVMGAINEAFARIGEKSLASENRELKAIVSKMEELRKSDSTPEQKDAVVLELLKAKVPSLIAGNKAFLNKTILEIGKSNMDLTTGLSNVNSYMSLIAKEMQEMGDKFSKVCTELSLSDDSKGFVVRQLNAFAQLTAQEIQSGNSSFLTEIRTILTEKPNSEEFSKIINNNLTKFFTSNQELNKVVVANATDSILRAIGGLQDKTSKDVEFLSKAIEGLFNNEEFQISFKKIINDSDLARVTDANKLQELIRKNHQEDLTKIDGLAQRLSQLVYQKDIQEFLHKDENGDFKGLLPEYMDKVLEECRKQGMSKDQTIDYFKSQEGREILGLSKQLSETLTAMKENTIAQERTAESIAKFNELYNQTLLSDIKAYTQAYGLARGVVMGGGVAPMGFAPYITQPYVAPQYTTSTQPEMDRAILSEIRNMLGKIGYNVEPANTQANSVNDKDAVIQDLKTQIADRDKQIAELKSEIGDLRKEIQELKNLITNKQNPQEANEQKENTPAEGATATETPKTPDKKEPQKTNIHSTNEQIKKANIKVPEPTIKRFIKDSIKNTEKLKEPKKPWYKRFGNWVKRHPLALTAITIGAGALVATGVGALLTGLGVTAATGYTFLEMANLYFPMILAGAGVGLGVGAVAEGSTLIARRFGAGRKERLYRKFQKQYADCESFREEIEKNEIARKNAAELVKASREKQRNSKGLIKKLGLYKMATKFNRKNLRRLNSFARKAEAKYNQKVEDALKVKAELNALENSKNKTLAMDGNLQKLRKKEQKIGAKIMNTRDEDEKADLMDDLQDAREDISDKAGVDLTKLSRNFQTFDAEAEELIKNVKSQKSDFMSYVENDINKRNSKVEKAMAIEVPEYDENEVKDYVEAVNNAGSEADKTNLKDLMKHIQEAKKIKEQSKGALEENEYLKAHPEIVKMLQQHENERER